MNVKINFYFNKTKARSIEAVLPALLSSARLLIPLHASSVKEKRYERSPKGLLSFFIRWFLRLFRMIKAPLLSFIRMARPPKGFLFLTPSAGYPECRC